MPNYEERYRKKPYIIERLVASLSYLTAGFVGFIWLILGIFTKAKISTFAKYHIYQSIFLSIMYFLLSQFIGLILNILSFVPFVGKLILKITFWFSMPIIFDLSIIQTIIYTIMFYLVLTSFIGSYSYLPWISKIIQANLGGNN